MDKHCASRTVEDSDSRCYVAYALGAGEVKTVSRYHLEAVAQKVYGKG